MSVRACFYYPEQILKVISLYLQVKHFTWYSDEQISEIYFGDPQVTKIIRSSQFFDLILLSSWWSADGFLLTI